jgi:hypothetical protein
MENCSTYGYQVLSSPTCGIGAKCMSLNGGDFFKSYMNEGIIGRNPIATNFLKILVPLNSALLG